MKVFDFLQQILEFTSKFTTVSKYISLFYLFFKFYFVRRVMNISYSIY